MAPFLDKSVVSTAVIGREAQLAALDHWLMQVVQQGGQVVLVNGEAGIGKSRLVAEAQSRAHQHDWQIVQGHCFEPDALFPYAPLIDLLRTFLTHRSADAITTLLGPLTAEVVKLLPELALTLPNLTPTPHLDPEAEKRRLFEMFVQFFVNLIHQDRADEAYSSESAGRPKPNPPPAPRPLLIIIEDLHWSDDTSLELLRYLARRLSSQPLLFVLTYRSDELNPTLQHFLAALSREQRPAEWTLPRLTPPEVDALLRDIFEQERPMRKEFLDAIFDLTGGNPFFIEEVLKVLVADGDIYYTDGGWARKPINELRIPPSVQDAVQRRVAQLSETAKQALTVAAVIGQQFDFKLLQAVTELPEADLLDQIKELLTAQLVVELSADLFAFRHALIRQAIYSDLLVRERQVLHRHIGETLEHREADTSTNRQFDPSTSPSATLAYHFHEAGAWEQTLTYARRAAEQAQALYTPQAAIEQLTRALQAANELKQLTLLPDLYRERGLEYEIIGDFDLAHADLDTVLQLARAAEDRHMEWQALIDLGKLWTARDYDQTGNYYQASLNLARMLDDSKKLARSLNQIGNWHLNYEAPPQAISFHEEALAIFQKLNNQPGLAQTLDLLGMTSLLSGDPVHGATYLKQAIDLFEHLDDRQHLASSLATLTICGPSNATETFVPAAMTLAECFDVGERAIQVARGIGFRASEAYASALLGQLLAAGGQYGRALELTQRGLEIAQEIEHREWTCLVMRELTAVYFDLLELGTSRRYSEQALAIAKEIGSSFHIRRTTGDLILLSVAEGQLSQAKTLFNAAGGLELPMQTLTQRSVWRGRAELALAQGDSAVALQIVDQLVTAATNTRNQGIGAIPNLAKLRGEALTALRRWSEAEETLLAGLATAQAQETPRLIWRIYVALGQLYQAQEQYARAEQAFAAVRTVIDSVAATIPDIELRDNFLRQANAMMSPPEASTPLQAAKQAHGGLTRREREVADLVAEGRSNREIAETLVLGVRTIEGHVSNILGKLGFTSRSEIAVWVVETGLTTDKD